MVEVDPIILVAAGVTVIGIAVILICTVKPDKKTKKGHSHAATEKAAAAPASQNAPLEKTKVGKKKAHRKSKAQKKAAQIAASETEDDAVNSDAKGKNISIEVEESSAHPATTSQSATSDNASESDSDDGEFSPQFLQSKRAKKAKETPEQKLARQERQKAKAQAKALLEAAAELNAPSPTDDVLTPLSATDASSADDSAQPDGWAVVESHRKKKPEDASPEQKEEKTVVLTKEEKKKKGKAAAKEAAVAALLAATAAESAAAAAAATATEGSADEDGASPTAAAAAEPPAPELVVDSVTTQMSVDSKKLGLLIGPKGATKIGIQNATGAEIDMPKTEKDFVGPVEITITGPAAGVGKASAAIHELCNKGYTMLLAPPDFQEGYIAVHQKYLADIIGKGGANIRAMQNHTGVKISTPAAPSKSAVAAAIAAGETPSKVKIGLAGLREQVTECRFLIKELIKYYHTAVTHPGVVHEEVDIPASYYNYVIGSKGAEIKHIQGNYSVSVHIPNSDSQCENILVVGQPEKVAQASAHIRKLVEKVDALNEKRAAEQAAREAEAAQRAANAAAAREARAAAAAAARGENVAGNAAPVAYSIGGGSNLAVDKSMRRRKNDEDERVPGDEWMDNFAPPSKGTSIMTMLPSKFTGKEGAAAAGEGEKSSADAETAAPATEAAAATTAAAEQKHSDTPAMEFPTPAEVLGRAGAGGAKPATAAAATASASMPAATGESSELEDGEVPESAAVAAAPAVPPGVWNKH